MATWWEQMTYWKRPWCWERLKAKGEEDSRGWDSQIASPTQRTWIRTNSGRWWRTSYWSPWDSPGKNTGLGCHALLQGIFLPRDRTQVSHIAGSFFTIWATREALSINIQGWFPLGLTGWLALQCKGFSRVFSSTIIQKYQLFSAQSSLSSNSHDHTRLMSHK